MIAGWLANKVFGIVVLALACLSTILLPVAVVQTVRLDGLTFLWWHIVEGAIPARDTALKARDLALQNLGTCHGNVAGLEDKIAFQNAKIADLSKETADARAKADAAFNAMEGERRTNAAKVAKILATKPGADQCQSADRLIMESLP